MRLAWFSPVPPDRSGISAYTTELLPGLSAGHAIDVFVDQPEPGAVAGARGVYPAHDLVRKQAREPYDLVVYQLGNASCHDYMWAYLARYPGLVVLHDGQLHHARARSLLQQKRPLDYRAEFVFDHPDAPPDIVELGVQGLLGMTTYYWPMLRVPIRAARLVAAHSERLAARVAETCPDAQVATIRMGVPDPLATAPPDARTAVLTRHNLPPDTVLFAAYGGVTPEKRIGQIVGALPAVAKVEPATHLLLVGELAAHYDATADARRHGVADRVTMTGFVDETELTTYLTAVDVGLCLRWPSTLETSASWLRCLAAGKPTIITDLEHTVDVPTLVTRGGWTPSHLGSLAAHAERPDPIAVSIDILDEDHSLALAMRRLARDDGLRRRLGQRARAFWAAEHTIERMVEDYERTLSAAMATPVAAALAMLPAHLLEDGTRHARELLGPFDTRPDFLAGTSVRNG